MSYASFLSSVRAGDQVQLYDTKHGNVIVAPVIEVGDTGFIFDDLGGFGCSARGNGQGYARAMKMMPLDAVLPDDRILHSSELEALV